jgi:hypothetical protein
VISKRDATLKDVLGAWQKNEVPESRVGVDVLADAAVFRVLQQLPPHLVALKSRNKAFYGNEAVF